MFKKASKYLFRAIGGRTIDRVTRWVFVSALTLWGPGPIIALIGYEGLIVAGAVTQSGVIRVVGDKILARM